MNKKMNNENHFTPCTAEEFEQLYNSFAGVLQQPDRTTKSFQALRLVLVDNLSICQAAKSVTNEVNIKTVKRRVERNVRMWKLNLERMREGKPPMKIIAKRRRRTV